MKYWKKLPTYVEITQKYDPDNTGFIDSCYEGQQYVLKAPSLNGARPTVLVWRKDWLEKVGIEKIPLHHRRILRQRSVHLRNRILTETAKTIPLVSPIP